MTVNELATQVLIAKEGYSKAQAESVLQQMFIIHPSWAVEGKQEVPPHQIEEKIKFFSESLDFWDSNRVLAMVMEELETRKEGENN